MNERIINMSTYQQISAIEICNLLRLTDVKIKKVIKTMAAAEGISMTEYVNKIVVAHCEKYLATYGTERIYNENQIEKQIEKTEA